MLFQWDDQDGWKYHDIQLMPFPSTSYFTLQRAISESSTENKVLEQPVAAASAGADLDDRDYWNAYGAPPDDISALAPRSAKDGSSDGTEDAYWAQYSLVQGGSSLPSVVFFLRLTESLSGSADSTVPSPSPNNRRLQPAPPTYFTQHEEAIPIPADTIHSLPLIVDKFGPPSPTTLAHLLNDISPRKDIHSPTSNEPPSTFDPDTPSPLSTVDNSDLVTPVSANLGQYAHVIPPVKVELNGMPFSNLQYPGIDDDEVGVEEDKALTESIKGIYCLWKARKWKQADEESSNAFLRIVRAAIIQP